ncbi:MAG: hypothetical protein ABF876_01680 [Acetobacter aceti]|uniref:hypothetical protein n=1 Tax=Acetobacter aceti TaxID=435 RepID=UPI0011EA58D5|nr:hypothetical protein [Acetobacter aceti]
MFQKTYLSPNPAIGQKGSKFTTTDANTIVGELASVVTGLGGTLDATQNNQVLGVLTSHFAPINSPSLTGIPLTTNPDGTVNNQIATVDYVNQKALSATIGFVPVQQNGGTNMGTNKVYIGEDNTLNWPTIQVDNGQPAAFTLQQNDSQTLGIKRIGWNTTNAGCWIQDAGGTGRFLVEQSQMTTALSGYLPLSGGNVTGAFTNIDANGFGFEYGVNDAAQVSYVDWHTVSNGKGDHSQVNDFDCRISVSGGTAGSNQTGNLTIQSATTSLPATTVRSTLAVQGTSSLDNGKITTDGSGKITASTFNNGTISISGNNIGSTAGFELIPLTGITNRLEIGTSSLSYFQNSPTATLSCSASGFTVNQNTTINGTISSTSSISSPKYTVDSGSGNTQIHFQNSSKERWAIGKNADSETGSNVGGNFLIGRFDDSGSYIDAPMTISRSTGIVSISSGLQVPTQAISDNSLNAASTAYVQNNLSSYVKSGTFPSLTGVQLVSGNPASTSVYNDNGKSNIVLHTNDGTNHYNIVNADGSVTLSGNITCPGKVMTDYIYNNGSGIIDMVSNVNVVAALSVAGALTQNGNTVATCIWTEQNYVSTSTNTSGTNDLNINYFGWSTAVGNKPYITHYQADGSTSMPVILATENELSNYALASALPTSGVIAGNGATENAAGYVGPCSWTNVDGVLTISFAMYLTTSGWAGTVTFPKSFSGKPYGIDITNAGDSDMDTMAPHESWTASQCTVKVPSDSPTTNSMISVRVTGPA